MLYLVIASVAATVGLVVYLVAQLIPAQPRAVRNRLGELGLDRQTYRDRQRQARRQQIDTILQVLGEKIQARYGSSSKTRNQLMHAGYRREGAVALYYGVRLALATALGALGVFIASLSGLEVDALGGIDFVLAPGEVLIGVIYGAAIGWIAPALVVGRRRRARQKELQLALPDALDLMVICVEAGLGLNQALLRVAQDMHHVSSLMTEELALVNFQIRAGTPRHEALTNLAERTGVSDIAALVTMLIQTDRFGTSVAQSLRVHSETLRMKRRQRAEEAAAKTAIKMLFPLVLFIFPALFVVILGPAIIQITKTLGGLF